MAVLRVKNWTKFQHYKKRSPPWIKLHRELLDDYEFICLPDASAALAPRLWLLASESDDGSIEFDFAKISFRLHMTEDRLKQALAPLVDGGLLQIEGDASGALARCLQPAPLEAEAEAEREAEREAPFADAKAVAVAKSADPTPDLPPIPASLRRGTRLSLESLPDVWRTFCESERPDLDPERTWAIFQDHWRGKAGQAGVKLDWLATWRNWVRREGKGNGINRRPDGGGGRATKDERAKAAIAKGLAVEIPEPSQ